MDQNFRIKDEVHPTKGNVNSLVMQMRKTLSREGFGDAFRGAERFTKRLKDFVYVNDLDENCEERLFSLTPNTAAAIMDSGFVLKGVDPNEGSASALIMALARRLAGGGGTDADEAWTFDAEDHPPPHVAKQTY